MNTMLTTAVVYKRNEIASWAGAQIAAHTAKHEELVNMSSLEQKQRLDGSYTMRTVATGFEQTHSLDADF